MTSDEIAICVELLQYTYGNSVLENVETLRDFIKSDFDEDVPYEDLVKFCTEKVIEEKDAELIYKNMGYV